MAAVEDWLDAAFSFPRRGNRRPFVLRRIQGKPLRGPPRQVVAVLPLLSLCRIEIFYRGENYVVDWECEGYHPRC